MSFFLSKTTSVSFFFSRLSPKEQEILDKLKMETEHYLKADMYNVEYVRLLVISFNDTAELGMDESIPMLKNFISFIRHRLIEGKPHEYKRLIHLLDAFNRNCGFRAQILIGRQKFLNTVSETARKYKGMSLPVCQECASIAFDCIQAWSEAFSKFKHVFPYYEVTYLSLKNKFHIQFPRPEKDKSRVPIPIDVSLLADKFPSRMYADETDTLRSSDGESDNESAESVGKIKKDLSYDVFDQTHAFFGEVSLK
jgi:hypothetical protein